MSQDAPESAQNPAVGRVLSLPSVTYESLKRRERRFRRRGFREETKAHAIYRSQAWDALKQEFFEARTVTGEYAHRSLRAFVRAKFEDRYTQDVAVMVVGRQPTGTVPWLGDWSAERIAEQVRGHAKVQALAECLAREVEVNAAAGPMTELFLDWVGRILNWSEQLDEATSGMLLLEGADIQANAARTEAILSVSKQLLDLMRVAVSCLMDARGGKQMIAMQIVNTVRTGPYQAEPGLPRQREILSRIVQIALERSKMYGLPTPEITQEAERRIEDEQKARADGKAERNGPPRTSSPQRGP